jgi:hypothetical protein
VRISKWEQQSIDRIRSVAIEARTKLKKALNRVKKEIETSLSQVTDQLKSSCKNEDYTETDLKLWMDKLESLKQQLKNTTEIELCGDAQTETNALTISLLVLKIHRIASKLMRISPLTLTSPS